MFEVLQDQVHPEGAREGSVQASLQASGGSRLMVAPPQSSHRILSEPVFMPKFPLSLRTPATRGQGPPSRPRFNVISSEVVEVRASTHQFGGVGDITQPITIPHELQERHAPMIPSHKAEACGAPTRPSTWAGMR